NNAPFVVGDGTNAASLLLYPGGTNAFPKGLRVAPNATLNGSGIIPCAVTNSGVLDPGLDYFILPEPLEIRGGLVLSNNSELRFDINGDTNAPCDFLGTSGNVVLGGKLSLGFTTNNPAIESLSTALKSKPTRSSFSGPILSYEAAHFLSTVTNGAGFVL